nr:MAG TPA: hypothetical protein [Caudoviricetes sp.]
MRHLNKMQSNVLKYTNDYYIIIITQTCTWFNLYT